MPRLKPQDPMERGRCAWRGARGRRKAALVANIKNGPTGIDSIVARHRAMVRARRFFSYEKGNQRWSGAPEALDVL